MVDILRNFSNSNYRFTSPIRFFKANDPIYYEVDNIPLKQLQENDLWLKDQIFGLNISSQGLIKRNEISELLPRASNVDNVITVEPGRFTARINDAYNETPLSIISKFTNFVNESTFNRAFTISTLSDAQLLSTIQNFKALVRLDLNGLYERAFSRPALRPNYINDYVSDSSPIISFTTAGSTSPGSPAYPTIGIKMWNKGFSDEATYVVRQNTPTDVSIGLGHIPSIDQQFIRKWRGAARTSVVDVPDQLSISIPAFNEQDHFYYNETGQKVLLNADQRIDLLFIYSKPVDTETATIAKFVNGVPQTITKAELGLIHGAGVGINFAAQGDQTLQTNSNLTETTPIRSDGTPKMLSHFGDKIGTYSGFKVSGTFIRGSFPSPDDIMNLNPTLDLDLDSSSYSLIGQTVLPIAYVVVKKNAQPGSTGVPTILDSDVIDIRPFFRTTELTYGERAGIAAAVPAPSFANPVTTQAELNYELRRLESLIDNKITSVSSVISTRGSASSKVFMLEKPLPVFLGHAANSTALGRVRQPANWNVGSNFINSTTNDATMSNPGQILGSSNWRSEYRWDQSKVSTLIKKYFVNSNLHRYPVSVILKFSIVMTGGEHGSSISPTLYICNHPFTVESTFSDANILTALDKSFGRVYDGVSGRVPGTLDSGSTSANSQVHILAKRFYEAGVRPAIGGGLNISGGSVNLGHAVGTMTTSVVLPLNRREGVRAYSSGAFYTFLDRPNTSHIILSCWIEGIITYDDLPLSPDELGEAYRTI